MSITIKACTECKQMFNQRHLIDGSCVPCIDRFVEAHAHCAKCGALHPIDNTCPTCPTCLSKEVQA